MKSSLTPFAFDDALVRVHTDDDGNPWFVAKDVCRVLEIEWKGSGTMGPLDDDEKGVHIVDTLGGPQEVLTVSESGLYSLIFRSRKPEARRFRKWVTSEVLPAIRKTGVYVAPGATFPAIPDAAKRLTPLLRERVLSDALQAVRISGSTDPADVDAYFAKYCAMIADTPEAGRVRLPGMALPHDVTAENIRRFIDECLVLCRGNRLRATDVYVAFRNWWRGQFDAALPSQNRFGKVMGEAHAKYRRGGSVYYANVAFSD